MKCWRSAHGARAEKHTKHTQPHWAGELPKAEARETSAVSDTGGPTRPRDAPERGTEGKGRKHKRAKSSRTREGEAGKLDSVGSQTCRKSLYTFVGRLEHSKATLKLCTGTPILSRCLALCQRPARASRARACSKSEKQHIGALVGAPVAGRSSLYLIYTIACELARNSKGARLERVRLRGG